MGVSLKVRNRSDSTWESPFFGRRLRTGVERRFLPRSGQAERGEAFPPSPCGGEQRGFGGGAPISPVRYGVATRRVFFFAAGTRKRRAGKWCSWVASSGCSVGALRRSR
jgi:hypothetical protein